MELPSFKVTLTNACKSFEGSDVIKNASFELSNKSRLAITGPNGSGKSTLLQMVLGYISPDQGRISIQLNQQKLKSDDAFYHMILASPALELPEELSLKELADFHFKLRKPIHGVDINDVIEESGLLKKDVLKPIRQYSSGMKQRCKLILAFATNSSLLLLDEPCINLDANGINWYLNSVEKYAVNRGVVVASNQPYEYSFCTESIHLG